MSREHLKRIADVSFASLFAITSAIGTLGIARAQEGRIPDTCYTDHEGRRVIDLRTWETGCTYSSHEFPVSAFGGGYIDTDGVYVRYLPPEELNDFTAGDYLYGRVSYMGDGIMQQIVENKQEVWPDYDPSQFAGAISLDACAHVGGVAWLRPKGSVIPWNGPYMIVTCAARPDMPHRVRNGYLVEVREADFLFLQSWMDAYSDHLEVVLQPASAITRPPEAMGREPISFADAWDEAYATLTGRRIR